MVGVRLGSPKADVAHSSARYPARARLLGLLDNKRTIIKELTRLSFGCTKLPNRHADDLALWPHRRGRFVFEPQPRGGRNGKTTQRLPQQGQAVPRCMADAACRCRG